jgi:hypothetical protein
MKEPGDESSADGPEQRRPTILELFLDGREIDAALKRGIRAALLRHKKLGNSIVVVRDGQVVELPPEEIPD